jgi:hypothetical protein
MTIACGAIFGACHCSEDVVMVLGGAIEFGGALLPGVDGLATLLLFAQHSSNHKVPI